MTTILQGFFIKESYRSKGIGKLFLQKLKTNYNSLKLCVYEKNVRAIRFYLTHVFTIKSKDFEEETQEYEYIMEWKHD